MEEKLSWIELKNIINDICPDIKNTEILEEYINSNNNEKYSEIFDKYIDISFEFSESDIETNSIKIDKAIAFLKEYIKNFILLTKIKEIIKDKYNDNKAYTFFNKEKINGILND